MCWLDALPGIVPCPLHLQYLLFNARLGHPALETVIKEIFVTTTA